jgi:hypothetical protein
MGAQFSRPFIEDSDLNEVKFCCLLVTKVWLTWLPVLAN